MTMKAELIDLLKKRWITPLDALGEVGCLSLSQRCGDLRREGLHVIDRWHDLPNGKRVKSYRLLGTAHKWPGA